MRSVPVLSRLLSLRLLLDPTLSLRAWGTWRRCSFCQSASLRAISSSKRDFWVLPRQAV
jgi:hypothetical protein